MMGRRRRPGISNPQPIQEEAMFSPALLALVVGAPAIVAIADVPAYDVSPSCRAAVTVMPGSFEACMKDEQSARAQLAASWDRFTASQRDSCVQAESNTGGPPSYVELLTCIQMAKDAQSLPQNKTDGGNR
jgi:hypothetical protein